MVCPELSCGEENLRYPDQREGGGVVLKIAANRSRQLGEVCASTFVIFSACKKICAHSRECYFNILQLVCQTFHAKFFACPLPCPFFPQKRRRAHKRRKRAHAKTQAGAQKTQTGARKKADARTQNSRQAQKTQTDAKKTQTGARKIPRARTRMQKFTAGRVPLRCRTLRGSPR